MWYPLWKLISRDVTLAMRPLLLGSAGTVNADIPRKTVQKTRSALKRFMRVRVCESQLPFNAAAESFNERRVSLYYDYRYYCGRAIRLCTWDVRVYEVLGRGNEQRFWTRLEQSNSISYEDFNSQNWLNLDGESLGHNVNNTSTEGVRARTR